MKSTLLYFLLVTMIFGASSISCGPSDQTATSNQLDAFEGHLYIVSRNSESKEGNIVLKYNESDVQLSHIGITFSTQLNATVYHISYGRVNEDNSALLAEPLSKFWSSPKPDENNIWKLSINESQYKRVMSYISGQLNKEIYFDFSQETSLGMYCSEFVYQALTQVDDTLFKQELRCVELKGFERMLANEDTLCFYPADFFLKYESVIPMSKKKFTIK